MPVKNRPKSPWELFNIEDDEAETMDVAATHSKVLTELQAIAAREHSPERDYPELEPRKRVADFVR